MRQLLVHNVRLLPNDQDLMLLPLTDVRLLQNQLQQELSKLALVSSLPPNTNHQSIIFDLD